jgi:nicotinamidase-related amidase
MHATFIDAYTAPVVLSPRTSALLIIDMQYASGSAHHGLGQRLRDAGRIETAAYRFDRIETLLIPNMLRLLAAFRAADAAVIYVTVGSMMADFSDAPRHMRPLFEGTNNHQGAREHEIVDALKPLPHEPVFNKVTMGAFASTGLGAYLATRGLSEIVVTGVSTNNCVGMTGMEAADRGLGVVLASDASGTDSEAMQKAYEDTFRRLWGRVSSCDEIIAEISGASR